jgi:hypothetical protein
MVIFYFVHGIPTETQFLHSYSRFNDKTRIRVAPRGDHLPQQWLVAVGSLNF